jgi:1-deoxy-D-xylulose-5-phosphate synthase
MMHTLPQRVINTGIAESHTITLAAGMTVGGLKPFAVVYSTFLQRAYDQIVHDIALQNLPVRMMIDRAGLVGADGATHHGIFDVSYLLPLPNVTICSPMDEEELMGAVDFAYRWDKGPIAVRYPNASQSDAVNTHFTYCDRKAGVKFDFDPSKPPKNIYVTYGSIVERVMEAKDILTRQGVDVGIVLVERIKPYAPAVECIAQLLGEHSHVVYVEEGIKYGGAAMITRDSLTEMGALSRVKFEIAAIDDSFATPKTPCDLYDYVGLSGEILAVYFLQ